jgi:hypothetical protein
MGTARTISRNIRYRRIMNKSKLANSVASSSESHQDNGGKQVSGTFVAVYRHRNGETLSALVRSCASFSYDVRLWALDEVHDDLKAWTTGSGPGAKYELINRLVEGVNESHYVIVADDDIVIARGDIQKLIGIGRRAHLDLFQASHAWGSFNTYPITSRRFLSVARETTFVEIGPLFVVAPEWRGRFLPFPDDIGMGWGLEIFWYEIQRQGCRFGVVDAVSLLHLQAPGGTYASDGAEQLRLERAMDENQMSLEEIQRGLKVWWRWQHSPPWGKKPARN